MNDVIKEIRLKLGMTQGSFAEAIGIGQSAVANYEAGYRKPEPNTVYAIIDLAKNAGIEKKLEDFYSRSEV
jgi:transcriptional regulator with XRE-family HTH domain